MAVRPLSASVLAGTSCVSDATRRVEYKPGKARRGSGGRAPSGGSGGRAASGGRATSGREQCSSGLGQQTKEQSSAGWAAQVGSAGCGCS